MPFDKAALQKLLHNKWAVGGLVAAAGLGGFVLYKRKSTTGSSLSGTTAAGTSGGQVLGPGTVNTTGDDVAAWLGNYSGNLQNITNAWGQQLTDALAHLPTGNGGTGAVGPYPGTPRPTGSKAYITKSGQTWGDVMNALGFTGTNAKAFQAWNASHVVTAGGKKSNPGASGYGHFGAGTVLAVPTSSPGMLA